MVLKKTFSASEQTIFIIGSSFGNADVSNILLKEIERFSGRNAIPVGQNENHCCERCLKAYLVKRISEGRLSMDNFLPINILFPCETGHNGYFMDNDNLVKI